MNDEMISEMDRLTERTIHGRLLTKEEAERLIYLEMALAVYQAERKAIESEA